MVGPIFIPVCIRSADIPLEESSQTPINIVNIGHASINIGVESINEAIPKVLVSLNSIFLDLF